MPLGTKPFDGADYLRTPEMVEGFLNEVIASGEPAAIQHALGVAARARGMTKIAKATGLSRENLYRSLSAGAAPSFGTMLRVAGALGLEFKVKLKKKPSLFDRVVGAGKSTGKNKTPGRAKMPDVIASGRSRKAAKSKRAV